MSKQEAREQLLDLLDKKAFNPILRASPDNYSNEADKKKLLSAHWHDSDRTHR